MPYIKHHGPTRQDNNTGSANEMRMKDDVKIINHTKGQNELFSEIRKLFSQSCTDLPAQLPSAMLPWQARGTCKKTVIQTSETVHFVSWYIGKVRQKNHMRVSFPGASWTNANIDQLDATMMLLSRDHFFQDMKTFLASVLARCPHCPYSHTLLSCKTMYCIILAGKTVIWTGGLDFSEKQGN